jgi:hypothetical protein
VKTLLLGALAALTLASPSTAEDRRIRDLTGSYPAVGMRRVELKLPPGEIRLEASPDGRLRVELGVFCALDHGRCEERAERLALETEVEGNTLTLRVEGMPTLNTRGLNLRGRILVPRGVALGVDLPAGELKIRGVDGDLDVDIGAGEVEIGLRERDVRSVRLGVGIGDASLSVGGRSIEGSGWLGHRVRWGEGPGPSRVSVNLGVGEVEVRLD